MLKPSASLLAAGVLLLSGASSAEACHFRVCAKCAGRAYGYGGYGSGYGYNYPMMAGYGANYGYPYPPYSYPYAWKDESSQEETKREVVTTIKTDPTVVNRLDAIERRMQADRIESETRIEALLKDQTSQTRRNLEEQASRISVLERRFEKLDKLDKLDKIDKIETLGEQTSQTTKNLAEQTSQTRKDLAEQTSRIFDRLGKLEKDLDALKHPPASTAPKPP
jgi:hypothetical protein